jgi:hypothetical protein
MQAVDLLLGIALGVLVLQAGLVIWMAIVTFRTWKR